MTCCPIRTRQAAPATKRHPRRRTWRNDEQPTELRSHPADFGTYAATRGTHATPRGSDEPAFAPDGGHSCGTAARAADGLVRAGFVPRRWLLVWRSPER